MVSMDFGVEIDGSSDFFQMFWPVVVSHKIDEKSPLYRWAAELNCNALFPWTKSLLGPFLKEKFGFPLEKISYLNFLGQPVV